MHERQCFFCSSLIINCNGFVIAGDMLDFLDGKIAAFEIRELCGKCVFIFWEIMDPADYYSVFDKPPRRDWIDC